MSYQVTIKNNETGEVTEVTFDEMIRVVEQGPGGGRMQIRLWSGADTFEAAAPTDADFESVMRELGWEDV